MGMNAGQSLENWDRRNVVVQKNTHGPRKQQRSLKENDYKKNTYIENQEKAAEIPWTYKEEES